MLTNSDRPCITPASKEPHHDHRTIHARRPRRQSLTDPGDEMLTLQEACRFLRRPEGTLRYWRHLGAGPRRFKLGRHVRYWRTDLVHWLTEQTNRPQERG
jgi:hypothetical protein